MRSKCKEAGWEIGEMLFPRTVCRDGIDHLKSLYSLTCITDFGIDRANDLRVNVSALRDGRLRYVLWLLVGILFCAQFSWFFGRLAHTWLENEEFTFGALIPLIVGYLLVKCRNEWGTAEGTTRSVGLVLVIVGCALQIAGS